MRFSHKGLIFFHVKNKPFMRGKENTHNGISTDSLYCYICFETFYAKYLFCRFIGQAI